MKKTSAAFFYILSSNKLIQIYAKVPKWQFLSLYFIWQIDRIKYHFFLIFIFSMSQVLS